MRAFSSTSLGRQLFAATTTHGLLNRGPALCSKSTNPETTSGKLSFLGSLVPHFLVFRVPQITQFTHSSRQHFGSILLTGAKDCLISGHFYRPTRIGVREARRLRETFPGVQRLSWLECPEPKETTTSAMMKGGRKHANHCKTRISLGNRTWNSVPDHLSEPGMRSDL